MKSHESDLLLQLVRRILMDAAAMCSADVRSVVRDFDTIKSRTQHEGISFLTISLPAFGGDFERALDQKCVTPNLFKAFKKRRGLPAFLSGFTGLVFDADTGILLDSDRFEAVLAVRQICFAFKKVLLPCTTRREKAAIDQFVQIEADLQQLQVPSEDLELFDQVSTTLWPLVFPDGAELQTADLLPKHGPGATVEHISGNQKYVIQSWHERLEPYFPLDSYAFASVNHMEEGLEDIDLISPSDEPPVRVTLVPKTLKTPRVIAIEPVCNQYTQQALLRYLVEKIEGSSLVGGHVNFTDQSINRRLALTSSRDRRLATLDLSAASDRVSCELALRMFSNLPSLKGALEACRSTRALLPDGRVISLRKFASMGSAVCFPVEAMYFLTIVLVALFKKTNVPVSLREVTRFLRDVYVYGDDILVPVNAAEVVSQTLANFGCKVNKNKSFWNGLFRESCGMDAYNGSEVTPTYIRRLAPRNKRDASSIISWVETCNLFYRKGFWQTASFIREVVESVIGKLPIKKQSDQGLGLVSFQKQVTVDGWSKRYQAPFRRVWAPSPVYKSDALDGYNALLKFFLRPAQNAGKLDFLSPAIADEDHLVRSARYGTVSMKRRKVIVS